MYNLGCKEENPLAGNGQSSSPNPAWVIVQVIRQARDSSWAYDKFLRLALEAELRFRQKHIAAQRLRVAHFPDIKTLDQLGSKALRGVS
jgi:hypothetical protein